jgi:hypothetical protein
MKTYNSTLEREELYPEGNITDEPTGLFVPDSEDKNPCLFWEQLIIT